MAAIGSRSEPRPNRPGSENVHELMKMRTKPSGMLLGIASLILFTLHPWPVAAQKPGEPIPHGQDRLPGPPLSPEEAIRKMTVPEGFTVELVASEPDIVN